MNRRNFIFNSFVAVITIPFIKYFFLEEWNINPFIIPKELSRFCDGKTIKELGKRYLQKFSDENDKKKLKDILLTDFDGKKINPNDETLILEFLHNKIHEEFSKDQTIILDGWVISRTEGRQCALFSFT